MPKSKTSLLALSLCGLSACTSWQVQPASPQQVLGVNQPQEVRITRTDSTTLVLSGPRIAGDTIFGVVRGPDFATGAGSQNAVALADVAHIAIRKGDAGMTTLAALGSAAVVAGIGFIIYVANIPED